MGFAKKYRYELALLVLIISAVILRFYNLNFQSLWYDELYTMNETDPSLSWHTFFDFYYKDEHPPLFFIIERLIFMVFGYEEHLARIAPAIFGVLCVPAIYSLGKELWDKRLGILSATMMTVNWFLIYHSQEARAYSLLCLFSILSMLFFLRIFKRRKIQDVVLFGVCTAGMLYSHYFSLVLLISELVLVVIFWVNEQEHKKDLLFKFFLGMLVAFLLYIPCLSFMLKMAKVEDYWNALAPVTFVLNYYADFFGAYRVLYPLLVVLPVIFYYYFLKQLTVPKRIKGDPLMLGGVVITTVLLLGFGIPYVRSLLVTPMIQSRYFTFTVPFFILMQAYAILLIRRKAISYSVFGVFIGLILYNHLFVKKYYTTYKKEDFRSLTSYIVEQGRNYPMVVHRSGWNQLFYLNKKGYNGRMLKGDMNATIDSILHSSSKKYRLDTLWMEGGWTDHPPTAEKKTELSRYYTRVKEKHYYLAWAELWVRR